MPPLGAHMSIAGGYYRAVEIAAACGCDCVQLFTKNNNQWQGKPIVAEDQQRFRDRLAELKISHPIAHDSYLINLASHDGPLWQKSVDALIVELERAEQLGLAYVVAHPGAYTTGTVESGIELIVKGLDEIHRRTPKIKAQILLETTAGQGSCLGYRFEELAAMLAGVKDAARLGVCFDTCHVFAAGYPLAERRDYLATMRSFDELIGLDRIRAFHLNDSKKELGSRVDRHEQIGRGKLGVEPFRHLVNDRRFRHTPMYLETPKGQEHGEELDVVNLRTLRSLAK